MTRAERAVALASRDDLTPAELGELNTLLDRHLNTGSPRLTDQLYQKPPAGWGFPPRFIKEGNRNTTRLARDVEALLSLSRHKPGDRRLELCLLLSDRLTQLKTLGCKIDPDGRIRYSANIGGTETQRHSCRKTAEGAGYNLHTTAAAHKHLFLPDPGHDLWNIDLSGADGWTIGCECAALNDRRMLDDLLNRIKPAQAVYLLFRHGAEANTWDYPRLRAEAAKIDKNGWEYAAFKRAIWAICYGSGDQTLISKIAEESFKETGTPIWVDVGVIRNMRKCVNARYPGIVRRQHRINMLLARDGCLDAPNGSRREFLDPPDDSATQRNAYSYTPQVMTTYCTSLAWRRLWYDPDNVQGDGSRIWQPILLVHDSIVGQCPVARRDWAAAKVREWFDNEVEIAGQRIKIPFSGAYGATWAHAGGILTPAGTV